MYILSPSHIFYQSLPSIGWALYAVCPSSFSFTNFLSILNVLLSGCPDRSCAIHSFIRYITYLPPAIYLYYWPGSEHIRHRLPTFDLYFRGWCMYIYTLDRRVDTDFCMSCRGNRNLDNSDRLLQIKYRLDQIGSSISRNVCHNHHPHEVGGDRFKVTARLRFTI